MTRIPRWKYDAVREAILDAVKTAGKDGMPFKELSAEVGARLDDDIRKRLGSIGWHTTVVKLNMEVEGELARVAGVSPQRIVLA